MHPAFSVIFLTTLIGVGQGLFLALYTAQVYAVVGLLPAQDRLFYAYGSAIVVVFLIAGLVASFFHLGHPERAWRSAAMWRTSWLSREVIVLPAMIGGSMIYGLLHFLDWELGVIGITTSVPGDLSLLVGAGTVVVAFALFLCTGMIYACIKFLQEWASWLTVVNYTLFGMASGFYVGDSVRRVPRAATDVFLRGLGPNLYSRGTDNAHCFPHAQRPHQVQVHAPERHRHTPQPYRAEVPGFYGRLVQYA